MINYILQTNDDKIPMSCDILPQKEDIIRLHIDRNRYTDFKITQIIHDTYPLPFGSPHADGKQQTVTITVIADKLPKGES